MFRVYFALYFIAGMAWAFTATITAFSLWNNLPIRTDTVISAVVAMVYSSLSFFYLAFLENRNV